MYMGLSLFRKSNSFFRALSESQYPSSMITSYINLFHFLIYDLAPLKLKIHYYKLCTSVIVVQSVITNKSK